MRMTAARGRWLAGGAGAELLWRGCGAFEARAGGGAEDQRRRVQQRRRVGARPRSEGTGGGRAVPGAGWQFARLKKRPQ